MKTYSEQFANRLNGRNTRALLIFAAYSMTFLVVCSLACKPKAAPAPKPQAKEPNTAVTTGTSAPEKAVVTVNGMDITEKELDEQVEMMFNRIAARTANLPPAFAEQAKKQFRGQALESLIVERLLGDKIKEANIQVTDNEVDENIKKMCSSQNPPMTLDDFKARVESQGSKFDEVRQQIKKGMSYQKLLQPQWDKQPVVTEDEARKYYTENQTDFDVPERVRASHILIATDPNVDPNLAMAQAKAKAEGLLKQVKDGADFAELAKANSSCPSKTKGGDLGFFTKGQMVEPFDKAAFALKPGELSDIVETQYGYHIIKVTDHNDVARTSFEQAKSTIITQLTEQKRAEVAQEYFASLKSKAKIVYAPGQAPEPPQTLLSEPNQPIKPR
jgi:peptidyl-prolyl cis-trans isomerase C